MFSDRHSCLPNQLQRSIGIGNITCSCVTFSLLISGIFITVIPPGTSGNIHPRDNGGGSEDRWCPFSFGELDTSYHVNETRLLAVSSFFKSQVGISISAEDQFTANPGLYIMKQRPQLTGDRILIDRVFSGSQTGH